MRPTLGLDLPYPRDTLGNFESPDPFRHEFQVDTYLFDFEGKNDISLPFLACVSPVANNVSMDTLENVLNIHDPYIPLTFLEESKDSKECESDAIVHDLECDDWYSCNVNEQECIAEEMLLEESRDEIEH